MFSDRLQDVMFEFELTPEQFARFTCVPIDLVNEWLNGKEPTALMQISIAKRLGLPADYFNSVVPQSPATMSVEECASYMNKSIEFVREGLKSKALPFGYAVKMTGKWSYWVSPVLFEHYTGIKVRQ